MGDPPVPPSLLPPFPLLRHRIRSLSKGPFLLLHGGLHFEDGARSFPSSLPPFRIKALDNGCSKLSFRGNRRRRQAPVVSFSPFPFLRFSLFFLDIVEPTKDGGTSMSWKKSISPTGVTPHPDISLPFLSFSFFVKNNTSQGQGPRRTMATAPSSSALHPHPLFPPPFSLSLFFFFLRRSERISGSIVFFPLSPFSFSPFPRERLNDESTYGASACVPPQGRIWKHRSALPFFFFFFFFFFF